jgi:nitrogen fixation/metabolism regulation signal transduction histidine kinase
MSTNSSAVLSVGAVCGIVVGIGFFFALAMAGISFLQVRNMVEIASFLRFLLIVVLGRDLSKLTKHTESIYYLLDEG